MRNNMYSKNVYIARTHTRTHIIWESYPSELQSDYEKKKNGGKNEKKKTLSRLRRRAGNRFSDFRMSCPPRPYPVAVSRPPPSGLVPKNEFI